MKEKNKNPLYVVKGDQVEAASGLFDMLVKKLNLEPFIEFMFSMLRMLMEYAKSYSAFMVIKTLFDDFMQKVQLFQKYSII